MASAHCARHFSLACGTAMTKRQLSPPEWSGVSENARSEPATVNSCRIRCWGSVGVANGVPSRIGTTGTCRPSDRCVNYSMRWVDEWCTRGETTGVVSSGEPRPKLCDGMQQLSAMDCRREHIEIPDELIRKLSHSDNLSRGHHARPFPTPRRKHHDW